MRSMMVGAGTMVVAGVQRIPGVPPRGTAVFDMALGILRTTLHRGEPAVDIALEHWEQHLIPAPAPQSPRPGPPRLR